MIAVFGLGTFNSSAQSTKFGHVNYVKVLDSLPSKKTADKDLNDFLEEGQKTITEMQASFEEEYNRYMIAKDSLSPLIQEMKEKSLMEQQQIIQYKSESLEQDLQILNDRLYKPLEDNLTKAVKTIAEKYKLNYILEVNSLLYVNEESGLDLTNEVRTELIRLEKVRTGK
jgi:outer membrane protein